MKKLRPKPKPKPMSIAVAMRARDGIYLMCDSRTTLADGSIRDDTEKLHSLRFADGNVMLLARVGIDEYSSQLVDIMLSKIKGRNLVDQWSGVELARDSFVELTDQIRRRLKGKSQQLQKFFTDHDFDLMVAYYWKGKGFLYTLNFALGSWTVRPQQYFAIGCGKTLADFLMWEMNTSRFTPSHAIWTGCYVIESVKSVDNRCGGPICGGFVLPGGGKSLLAECVPANLEETSRHVRRFIQNQRRSRLRTAETEVNKQIEQIDRRARKELKRNGYVVAYEDDGTPVRVDPNTGIATTSSGENIAVQYMLPRRKKSHRETGFF